MGGMLVYNSHILAIPTFCTCISLQHASKSYLKEKKKVFVFAFFIKPTCRLTEDHFRNRHSSMTWRKNQISLLTGSSPRRRLLMTKKRSSHGVMIMVEPVRLSALPSPPAPLHLSRPKFSAGELVRSSSRRWIDGARLRLPGFLQESNSGAGCRLGPIFL